MVNKIWILGICFILAVSCKKSSDPILPNPDERLAIHLKEIDSILTDAEHGWVVSIYPKAGGGYSFYMDFDGKNRVMMRSDFNEESATVSAESSYRLKAQQRPMLIFDTYNYLHLLHDPQGSISGGSNGQGLVSDFEFVVVELKDDYLKLEGILNKNIITLKKATEFEKSTILANGWKNVMGSLDAFMTQAQYLYVQDGIDKIALDINIKNRKTSITWNHEEEGVVYEETYFNYSADGLAIEKPLKYKGKEISKFILGEGDVWKAVVDGEEVLIHNSSNPLLSFMSRFGFNKEFQGLRMERPSGEEINVSAKLISGVNSPFVDAYNQVVNTLESRSSPMRANFVEFRYVAGSMDSKVALRIGLQTLGTTTQYVATMTFDYVQNEEYITLKYAGPTTGTFNGNWNSYNVTLNPLFQLFFPGYNYADVRNGVVEPDPIELKLDWVNSQGYSGLLGGIYRVGDPEPLFYSPLQSY